MISTLVQVALGGAIGAVLRYSAGAAITRFCGPGFPWGTMFVNIFGSFLMGLLIALAASGRVSNGSLPFLAVGVLGGFTTFSAFSLDAIILIERGQFGAATLYVFTSVLVSLAALVIGLTLGRAFTV